MSSADHGVTLQGAQKDSFGKAVVGCDIPEPCKFSSPDNCEKRFLWIHKQVDLPPHSVVGLVLQVRDTENFPHALGFESLDPVFQGQQTGSMFHSRRRGWR